MLKVFIPRLVLGGILAAVTLLMAFTADVQAALSGKSEKPAWMQKRPQPEDLDFFAIKQQLTDYLKTVPEQEREAEKERIRLVSTLREYLIKLLKAPYEGEVKLKGHSYKGSILCNENELDIKAHGSRKFKRIRWEDVPIEQYIVFFDFYMNYRLKQEDAQLRGKAGEEKRKKEAAQDGFNIALLSDWYGEEDSARKYIRLALAMNPEMKDKAQQLLALYLDPKEMPRSSPPPVPTEGKKPTPKEEPATSATPAKPAADEPPGGSDGSLKISNWQATDAAVEINLQVTCQPNTPFNLSLWADTTEIRKFGFEVTGENLPDGADVFKPFTSAKHGQRLMPVALKNATMKLTFPITQKAEQYQLQINDQKLPLLK